MRTLPRVVPIKSQNNQKTKNIHSASASMMQRREDETNLGRGLFSSKTATVKEERDCRGFHRLAVTVRTHQLAQSGGGLDPEEHLPSILQKFQCSLSAHTKFPSKCRLPRFSDRPSKYYVMLRPPTTHHTLEKIQTFP